MTNTRDTRRITVESCNRCGAHRLAGKFACRRCGASDTTKGTIPALAVVRAATQVFRAPIESPVGVMPFWIALASPDAAPELVVMVASAAPLAIGVRIEIQTNSGMAPYLVASSM